MSSNRITRVERIAILSRLVEKYCVKTDIVNIVRLAKDLANVIDELNYMKVELSELAHEFLNFFPEHWKKRTRFLLIITKYWAAILKERNLTDIEVPRWNEPISQNPTHYNFDLFQKVSIFENANIYDEIDFVIRIINEHAGSRISIVSPNRDFSRFLMIRLDAEHIDYTSHCGNNNPSQKIIDAVNQNFNNHSKEELKKIIKELSDIIEYDIADEAESSRKVFIIPPIEIYKIPKNELTIHTELNESVWKPREAGYFWLHHTLRRKLGLIRDASFVESLFYRGLAVSKKVYLLRSLKSEGQNNKKSAILAKFEAIAKKEGMPLDYPDHGKCCTKKAEENHTIIADQFKFELPNELDVWDVELLAKAPQAFFAKKILGIQPPEHDPAGREIRHLFKKITKSYFKSHPLDMYLETLKKLDFFAYHKALNLVEFLKTIDIDEVRSFDDIRGKIEISEIGILLSGRADRIIETESYSTLISFRSSASHSTKEIIYDGCSSILGLCLIAENHGFNKNIKPIRKIQIWNLMAMDENKIIDKEIEISTDILNEFSKRFASSLKPYCSDEFIEINCNTEPKGLYNEYKHFVRF